jgi:hypothetical protein
MTAHDDAMPEDITDAEAFHLDRHNDTLPLRVGPKRRALRGIDDWGGTDDGVGAWLDGERPLWGEREPV